MEILKNNYLFYDLETNGLDYYTTGILQICIIGSNGNTILNQYTYPFDNRIEGTEIHGIDKNKLIENNAIETNEMLIEMKKRIRNIYGRDDVYLIAYNNFGYDQIILENNFKKQGIRIPNNWYFIDLYPIVKELYDIKPNYKLSTVFKHICGDDPSINYHCALADTTCLYKIFNKINSGYDIFAKYTRGGLLNGNILSSPVTSINGYNNKFNFESKGILKIDDVYMIFKQNNCDNIKFENYLRNTLGIYSNFYINNLIKQINIIHYFNSMLHSLS